MARDAKTPEFWHKHNAAGIGDLTTPEQVFRVALAHHALWLLCGRRTFLPDATLIEACEARTWQIPDWSKAGDGGPMLACVALRWPGIPVGDGQALTGCYVSISTTLAILPVYDCPDKPVPIPQAPLILEWGDDTDDLPGECGPGEDDWLTIRVQRRVAGILAVLSEKACRERVPSAREMRPAAMQGLKGGPVRILHYDLAGWQIVEHRYRPSPDRGGTHAPPVAHYVQGHEALYWVRDPRPDEEVHAVGVSEAMNPLFAVKRPVRAHRRGAGEVEERVTKLVEDQKC
jgi:hypothetical protein